MKNRIMKQLRKYILLTLPIFLCGMLLMSLSGCSKTDVSASQITLTNQMLADKTWYLDYTQTITSAGSSTRTYVGQSTYFISLLKDNTTVDSDGIRGTYTVDNSTGNLVLKVVGKTSSGTTVSYSYTIESVGANNLITKYTVSTTNTTVKQFFSAK
jgi:hypothetical protein